MEQIKSFLASDPLVAALLLAMVAGVVLALWHLVADEDRRREAEDERRRTLDRIMRASPPRAPGIGTRRVS